MLGRLGRCLGVSAALLAVTLGARATIVVDAAGGGDFTSLQEALFFAADGEQVLVRTGNYDSVGFGLPFISGKGLSIVAEAGADVVIAGLGISDVPAGHWVIVRGITIDVTAMFGGGTMPAAAVEFTGPNGSVWLEDCKIRGANGLVDQFGIQSFPAQSAVRVVSGGSVTLHRCTLEGGTGPNYGTGFNTWDAGPGAPAVHVYSGRVALHECTLKGGQGGPGEPAFGGQHNADGGAGLLVGFGSAHVSGCSLTGGSNGNNVITSTDSAGDGLVVVNGSAWMRDSTAQPGTILNSGLPGQAIVAPPDTVTTLSAPSRSVSISSPLREGQLGTLQIQGQQGDQVVLLIALGGSYVPKLSKQGVFALDPSVLLLPVALGSISDPGGALALPFVTPNLNPVLDGLTVPMQLVVSSGGVTTLEGGTAMAWLDASL